MAGPILEKVKEQLESDETVAESILEDSPLVSEYSDELGRRVPDAGGCCSAAEVAEAMRREQRYD